MLNRPLLLTGEPGTGKTKFADFVKDEYHYKALEKFYTKSISLSQDLFYDFDAIAYFASEQLKEGKPITTFIYLKALGKAICNALGSAAVAEILQRSSGYAAIVTDDKKQAFADAFTRQLSPDPISSIVLIDEIDKAPRDFPNDILNEIDEQYKFKIKELDIEFILPHRDKILVLITSNFEKNLPDPFLRRCVYFNIVFPGREELLTIVCSRVFPEYQKKILAVLREVEKPVGADAEKETTPQDEQTQRANEAMKKIINRVNEIIAIRDGPSILKKPSTSEILDFFYCVQKEDLLAKPIGKSNRLIGTLLKRKEDLPQS
jgi:MoxR-like ATPase